ncbi:hypothetical protein LXL04_010672 [Taraxacum kok-saghyz]
MSMSWLCLSIINHLSIRLQFLHPSLYLSICNFSILLSTSRSAIFPSFSLPLDLDLEFVCHCADPTPILWFRSSNVSCSSLSRYGSPISCGRRTLFFAFVDPAEAARKVCIVPYFDLPSECGLI